MELQKNRLVLLREKGFRPRVILDIGAYKAEWANMAQEAFPGAMIVCFEANDQHTETLKQSGFRTLMGFLVTKKGKKLISILSMEDHGLRVIQCF